MQNNQRLSRWLVKEALIMRAALSGWLVQLGGLPEQNHGSPRTRAAFTSVIQQRITGAA